jgi:hypothetical protein
MKTQQDMHDWLDKDYLKLEIRPKWHVNGWRVVLFYDYYEVCVGWGNTIEEAFTDAEQRFDFSLAKILDKALADAEKRCNSEICSQNDKIKRIREQQQANAVRMAKSVHGS